MAITRQISSSLIEHTTEVVVAYVANHRVPPADLASVIAIISAALKEMGHRTPDPVTIAPLVPAAPIKKSVMPGYIISLEDGKRYKFLKRHLSRLGMTPDEYRKKWGLPADYPMVAPEYSARRTEIALSFGLGRKKVAQPEMTAPPNAKQAKKPAAAVLDLDPDLRR